MNKNISVIRREHFNCAHRLHNPKWSDEKNTSFYGKCNNPNCHGHNYNLEVTVTGELDAATGDFSGDVDVDGTLEADAITIGGVSTSTLFAGPGFAVAMAIAL